MFSNKKSLYLPVAAFLLLGQPTWAQAAKHPAPGIQPFVVIMIVVMLVLLLVIKLLAGIVVKSARRSWAAQKAKTTVYAVLGGLFLAASMLAPGTARAEDQAKVTAVAASSQTLISGVSNTTFYALASVTAIEIVVILYLVFHLRSLLSAMSREERRAGGREGFSFSGIWGRMNSFQSAAEEEATDTGHEYDGIRELNNKLPPWWLYGFYGTIIFAVIYFCCYHVFHLAPLPAEEYKIAMHEADVQKAAYLKKTASNIDESNVKQLTSQADLAAGKAVFQTICFACHGKSGEGGVGPNLTDAYWLHGGSIQSVFKTIKYGWPEKGMKSWKDDFSPLQIEQIASYVKSLGGSNPPNPKAPQGTLEK